MGRRKKISYPVLLVIVLLVIAFLVIYLPQKTLQDTAEIIEDAENQQGGTQPIHKMPPEEKDEGAVFDSEPKNVTIGTPDAVALMLFGDPDQGYLQSSGKGFTVYQLVYGAPSTYGDKHEGPYGPELDLGTCPVALVLDVQCPSEKTEDGYDAPRRSNYADYQAAGGEACTIVRMYCT